MVSGRWSSALSVISTSRLNNMTVSMEMEGALTNDSSMLNATMTTPLWVPLLDSLQLSGAIVGIFANLATTITLSVNGDDFTEIIRMLFTYQSFLDCLVCLNAALLFGLPPLWTVGNVGFDTFICQAWHGQFIYWWVVLMSVHNLVTLAAERYLCVCHPLKYQAMSKTQFRRVMIALAIIDVIFISPGLIQTRLRDGVCHSELFFDTPAMAQFFFAFAISGFFWVYAVPCMLFLILYGLVILSFRKRAESNLGASTTATVITKATTELTKTAIVVTIIFAFALGFDLWFYFFAHLGLLEYVLGSPMQKVAVFFSVINSVVNPFVYASFMPLYRKSVMKTFFSKCSKT